MIAVIDNYDSFTYNLVQYLGQLGGEPRVFRNDAITRRRAGARWRRPGSSISPGPETPERGGHLERRHPRASPGKMPILGVCLGHQASAEVFGGEVVRADRSCTARPRPILHDGRGLFAGLSNPFAATRYHSLIVEQGLAARRARDRGRGRRRARSWA